MSDSTIPIRPTPFSVYLVKDEEIIIPENRIMLTTQLEIDTGTIDVEGALEIV